MDEKIDLIPFVLMCADCRLMYEEGMAAYLEKYKNEGGDWLGSVPPVIMENLERAEIGRYLGMKKDKKNMMPCSFCSDEAYQMAKYEGEAANSIDLMKIESYRAFIERRKKQQEGGK